MPNEKPSAFAALVEGLKAVFGFDGQPQSADSPSPQPEHADTDPLLAEGQRQYNLFVGLIIGSWALTLLLWAIPAFTSLDAWGISFGGFTLAYGFVLWVPITLYIIASIRVVQTYERGGIMVLEKPVKEVEPGLQFVPLTVCELQTYPINPQQSQFPGEPEDIFKGDDDQTLPQGKVRAIRATTHAAKAGEKCKTFLVKDDDGEVIGSELRPVEGFIHDNDHLNVQKTIEVTFFVIWKVMPGNFFRFYLNIPGETWEDKMKFVEGQIRDSAETDLVEQIAKHTLGEVLFDIEGINRALTWHVQENLKAFGIEILEARMQNPDISKKLNAALQSIAEARATREKTRTDAEAERYRLEQIGEGEAAQIRAREKAKGEGQRAAADAMSMDPAEYRAGEVAEDALKDNSTFVIGAEGIAEKIISAFTAKPKGGTP